MLGFQGLAVGTLEFSFKNYMFQEQLLMWVSWLLEIESIVDVPCRWQIFDCLKNLTLLLEVHTFLFCPVNHSLSPSHVLTMCWKEAVIKLELTMVEVIGF